MRRKEQRLLSKHGMNIFFCSCWVCIAERKTAKKDLNRVFRRRMKQADRKEVLQHDED